MDIKQIVLDLCAMNDEQEWFEFKENWFQPETLGEYVSALSNAAAFHYKKYAYFVWGIEDENHKIVGTTFNQYCDYNKEPYQNYLARNLYPSLNFSFEEIEIQQKRVIVLVIPAALEIPTAFKEKRYIRIGSSKCNIKDYPRREIELFKILSGRAETIETIPAKYQELTFRKLFGYYGSKGIVLNDKTFIKNLGLRNEEGQFNLLAQLLSDFVNKEQEKCIFFSVGYAVAVILDKPHNLVRKGFPAGLAEMDMYIKCGVPYPLHKVGRRGQRCGGAGLAGVIVHRLSFLFSSVLRCSIFACALAFLKFSPVIQTGEHITIKRS